MIKMMTYLQKISKNGDCPVRKPSNYQRESSFDSFGWMAESEWVYIYKSLCCLPFIVGLTMDTSALTN
jgi:hypothetical protein